MGADTNVRIPAIAANATIILAMFRKILISYLLTMDSVFFGAHPNYFVTLPGYTPIYWNTVWE